jgi:hypothetical protein
MDEFLRSKTRRQHGLVTRQQLAERLKPHQIDRRVVAGQLELVRRGVYRIAGAPETWEQHLLAACLARSGSVASFRAAAFLWALPGFDQDVFEITVPGIPRARLDGVVVHESQVWGPRHIGRRAGIPVSSVARVLCDLSALSAYISPIAIERAVDDALRRKILTVRALENVSRDLSGRGRRRSTVTRAIVEARGAGYHPGESEPEKRIADLLERSGLPRPVAQYRIRIGKQTLRADLAYPELGIVIEYDSREYHSSKSALDADAKRRNRLRLAGLMVLELTAAASDREIVDVVTQARLRASVSSLLSAVAN